jgi:hypothetical protein
MICTDSYNKMLKTSRSFLRAGVNQSVQSLTADDRGSIPCHRQRISPVVSVSRPALRSAQPPVQWVLGSFPRGESAGGAWRWATLPIVACVAVVGRLYFYVQLTTEILRHYSVCVLHLIHKKLALLIRLTRGFWIRRSNDIYKISVWTKQ